MNAVINENPTNAAADIDALDVSPAWKTYFHGVKKYGGPTLPGIKALPKQDRKAALKEVKPPMASTLLAFIFGFLYYLTKGMWKKGLVLLGIVIVLLLVLATVFTVIGMPKLVDGLRFLGGAIFMITAPRDFYAFKVQGDRGWMPVSPF